MKYKICIDARMIRNSGIGVYIENYTFYLLSSPTWFVYLIGSKVLLQELFGKFSNWQLIEDYTPIYTIKEQFMFLKKIPICDIFWSPHYNVPLFPIRARRRIVTVPDIIHLVFKSTFSFEKRVYAQIVMNSAVRISDVITTISEFSKSEIVKYTHINPHKVYRIYLGLDDKLFSIEDINVNRQFVLDKYNLPKKYLLFVGNVKPHKNLVRLILAFKAILSNDPEIRLVIAGKKEGFITGDSEVFSMIETDKELSTRVHFTGYIDTQDLPIIYNLASLFVFPSLYEGFGFPPLEAMACSCPVVASKFGSIKEVCGDAAYYFNPEDIEDISSIIEKVLYNETVKLELIQNGLDRIKLYNWGKSFNEFEVVLKKTI